MQVNTKFNIGDAVWILDGYNIRHANIVGVKFEQHGESKPSIIYTFAIFPMRKELECFATEEELIKFLTKKKR